jgi:Ca2+-binding RTX toxin-like protein
MPIARSRFSASALLASASIVAAAALAVPAGAAQVSVHEQLIDPATAQIEFHGGTDPNIAQLEFDAGPGEDNRLTITFAQTGDGYFDLVVKDEGAALTAGAGCTGGGGPGQVAHCRMHEPKAADRSICGKMCETLAPASEWEAGFDVSLGDGSNAFDGRAFAGTYSESVAMKVSGGDGADRILTGNGTDAVDPGAGSDEVQTGEGADYISATAAPDGPDSYSSFGVTIDTLDYSLRSAPVELGDSIAGAPGEMDSVQGTFEVVGGSGNDVLVGGPKNFILRGGPGNDVLAGVTEHNDLYGGSGQDRLSTEAAAASTDNVLVGGAGNDAYYGGPGEDVIRERESDDGNWKQETRFPSSDDAAYGRGGRDVFELRAGNDAAFGGGGEDSLHGGRGKDLLVGAVGNDQIIGGSGFDWLKGGLGADRLFSGRWRWNDSAKSDKSFPFPTVRDDGRDLTGCGAGPDLVFANPLDRLRGCEEIRLRPRPKAEGR